MVRKVRIWKNLRKNETLLLTKQFNHMLQAFILFDIQLPNIWFKLLPLFLRWLMTLVCRWWDIYERHSDELGKERYEDDGCGARLGIRGVDCTRVSREERGA